MISERQPGGEVYVDMRNQVGAIGGADGEGRTAVATALGDGAEFTSSEGTEAVLLPVSLVPDARQPPVPVLPEIAPRLESDEAADNEAILRILDTISATDETRSKHQAFVLRLDGILKGFCGPRARVDAFGSTVSGFATRGSDLDLTLEPARGKMLTCDAKKELLLRLSKHLRFRHHITSLAVLTARVPVVRLRDPATGVCADLSVQNTLPVVRSQLFKEYSSIDSRVRPLVMLVKAWAQARGINSSPLGTLSSFGYSILVLHFLQHLKILPVLTDATLSLRGSSRQRALAAGRPGFLELPGNSPRSVGEVNVEHHRNVAEVLTGWGDDDKKTTAALFAAFFEYYSQFDFENKVVAVGASSRSREAREARNLPVSLLATQRQQPSEEFRKDAISFHPNQKTFMCLQDPLDPCDNVSRNVFANAAKRIQGEFTRAHTIVREQGLAAVIVEAGTAPAKKERRVQTKTEVEAMELNRAKQKREHEAAKELERRRGEEEGEEE